MLAYHHARIEGRVKMRAGPHAALGCFDRDPVALGNLAGLGCFRV